MHLLYIYIFFFISYLTGPLFNIILQLNTLCMQQIHDSLEIFHTL